MGVFSMGNTGYAPFNIRKKCGMMKMKSEVPPSGR
jgi:hypothetical protein